MSIKIIATILIATLFVGCAVLQGPRMAPDMKDNNSNEYNYNGFILEYPKELKSSMYVWTKGDLTFTPSNYKVLGKDNKKTGAFIIDKKSYPVYDVKFNEEVEIIQVKFKLLPFYEKENKYLKNSTPNYFKRVENFLPFEIDEPRTIQIFDEYDQGTEFEVKKMLYSPSEKAYIINNPFEHKTKSFFMQVTELNGHFQNEKRVVVYYPDELSFLVKNKEAADEIIDYNLRNSNDIGNNEQLIRFIALEDEKLFRKLQRNVNQYKLKDISFLKLPNDINIKYAMDNFSDVISTGKYKDINGKTKTFNASKIYPNLNYKYSSNNNTIRVNENKSELKLSDKEIKTNRIKNDGFIDFDKGIE